MEMTITEQLVQALRDAEDKLNIVAMDLEIQPSRSLRESGKIARIAERRCIDAIATYEASKATPDAR
jgi:hypothetical protein